MTLSDLNSTELSGELLDFSIFLTLYEAIKQAQTTINSVVHSDKTKYKQLQ